MGTPRPDRSQTIVKVVSRGLFVLGSTLLLVGLVAGVFNRQVLDGGRFAVHVDAVTRRLDKARASVVSGHSVPAT